MGIRKPFFVNRFIFLVLGISMSLGSQAQGVWYVDVDAPGGNGTSWNQAFNGLQSALAAATTGDEIRVAEGTYTPAGYAGSRYATFHLINGVTIRGGYAGYGQPNPDERDVTLHETILSGDLNGDDGPDFANNDENSYNIVTGSGTNSTAVLDGFTITKGNGNGSGEPYCAAGGLICQPAGSPTVSHCTFVANSSIKYGAAIGLWGASEPTITNCSFIGNVSSYGGVMINAGSGPLLIDCVFSGNSSANGGVLANHAGSYPTLINCVLSDNSAINYGGAMINAYTAAPTLINCTIVNNQAGYGGASYSHSGAHATFYNAIIWGNSPGGIQPAASATATYSDIQGGWPGAGNIAVAPGFVSASDYHLSSDSLCMDAGNNGAPGLPATDGDGNPRIVNGSVDMGAYERQGSFFVLSTDSLAVPEGGTAPFTVALDTDPLGSIQVTVAYESGDSDLTVQSGSLLTFDSSDYATPQPVMLAAAEDSDFVNGEALIRISASGFNTDRVSASEQDNESVPTVVYVDADAPGSGAGTSWTDAFPDLQDAMSIAAVVPQIEEIRVAQGIYVPAGPSGIREATFQLRNGLIIKGGYAGFGEPDPHQRDVATHETTLSGDLNDNDGPDFANNDENSYHVVSGSDCDATAVLDGFTIRGGNANGVWEDDRQNGGGMFSRNGGPTVSHCTFDANSADWDGGGMYNTSNSNPVLNNCTFTNNSAGCFGGGMANDESNPLVTNCVFLSNTADNFGGGMSNSGMDVGSDPTLTNCVFLGNSTSYDGGGLFNLISHPSLVNCIFSGNSADYGGGVANYDDSYPTLTNCAFSGNVADYTGGAVSSQYSSATLANCIAWGNTPSGSQISGSAIVNYSDIQGGFSGTSNINANPLFADADGSDDQIGTDDDDLRLATGSPCIDAGSNAAVPADLADLDDDGNTSEPTPLDLDGDPRFQDGSGSGLTTVDMGAYEALMGDCVTPGTPVADMPTNIGPTSADFSWSPGDPLGNGTIDYYWAVGLTDTVTYENGYEDRGTTIYPNTTANTSALSATTTYYFTVKACTRCDDTCSDYDLPPVEFATPQLPVPGDFDGDYDVDQADYAHLQACLSGRGVPQDSPNCQDTKLDYDADVDADDVDLFLGCLSGPNTPGDPNCIPAGADVLLAGETKTLHDGEVILSLVVGLKDSPVFNEREMSRALASNDSLVTPALSLQVDQEEKATTLDSELRFEVTGQQGDQVDVTFFGQELGGADFTIVALPDTQHYACGCGSSPGNPMTFRAQTQWVVDNRAARNIVFVAHLGDIIQDYDDPIPVSEWEVANEAMGLLEDPVTTSLPYGIPYGLAVGNHDMGNAASSYSTRGYNLFFGPNRFEGRTYYGGHSGTDNDNSYQFFSAGGMDFVVVNLEYNHDSSDRSWANARLQEHSDKRAIVVCHYILENNGTFAPGGLNIYNTLRGNANLFLMLCGHVGGEARRTDTYAGTVHSLLSDYQDWAGGGNGYLRIMEFSPTNNEIRVKTYSPTLDMFLTGSSSQFTLPYDMGDESASGFVEISSVTGVTTGTAASVAWPELRPGRLYEWYVTVSDGTSIVTSPTWCFSTAQDDLRNDTVPSVQYNFTPE